MKAHCTILALIASLAVAVSASAQTPPPTPANADAVIQAFKAADLEAESPKPMTRKDYGKAPFLCKGVLFLIPSLGEGKDGHAFYCARKADRDRLARYYTGLGEQSAELFSHVFVNAPYLVQINGDLSDEQAAKYEAALVTLAPGASTMNPPGAIAQPKTGGNGFKVEILKVGYENWGRPRLMDNPNYPDCGEAVDAHPMLKLGMSLELQNTGTQPWPTGTRRWMFYKTDGTEAFSCFYDFMIDKPYPETPPGGSYVISVLVFVERNERVGSGVFKVEGVGEVRFDIPPNLSMP